MKRMAAFAGALFIAGCALAQDGEHVVVPARNSSRPRMVNASTISGSITVKAYDGKEVIVETSHGKSRENRRDDRENRREDRSTDGLKRLDMPGRSGLEVEEEDNNINIRTSPNHEANLIITVPVNTSLKLKGINGGEINVDGVNGEIEVTNINSRIVMTNISGSVIASSTNGSVKVAMNRVDPGKQLSFSSLNGSIDVTLPADLKANVKLRADNGDIYTDFDVKFDAAGSKPITENNSGEHGKFRVRFDRTVTGTINGGGPEVSFHTFNGRISIRKK